MKKKSILFVVPAFLIYTILLIVPIIGAFFLSLTDWNGISAEIHFVGIKNYLAMLSDKRLFGALLNTVKITVTVCIAVNAGGLALAFLLNKSGKLTNFLRSIFFLPYVLSTVAISFVWMSILSYTGILNSFLEWAGLSFMVDDFIGNAQNAIISICVVEIWRTIGFYMVIYLAYLQTVPMELYEACMIDGGSAWQQFRFITLPQIVPGITICTIMSVMTEMRQYDIVKVITNGGPGYSTETITYNIVTQAFGNNMLGYSSAIAVFLFVLIAGLSVLQIKVSGRLGEGE
ncbi:MAG: sugar ABC transporter permease [Candidatus Limivivens sp.]|nr:sugar ABC transporter permease [Candidatus Limivivens sp.]